MRRRRRRRRRSRRRRIRRRRTNARNIAHIKLPNALFDNSCNW
jgi:hypothetical protein